MIEVRPGSILLEPDDVRLLYEIARIRELRGRYRIGNTTAYELLTAITVAKFRADAAGGILPRQTAASEERAVWSVEDVAKASKRSTRAVRNDCSQGTLTAQKVGGAWNIPAAAATTYIRGRTRL